MLRPATPLFDGEQQKTPEPVAGNSSPISAYTAYCRSKQHVPVITPPPQKVHNAFSANGWPDRSSSSANLHQSQRSKQQGDEWRPNSPRSPHLVSQDARRHGSAPQLNNTSPIPFQHTPRSPKNQKNKGSPQMSAQGSTQMTNSERIRQFENQKKQNASHSVNKAQGKSESKGTLDTRKKKPWKRNEKKSTENIELNIRTIYTNGQSRESRNRVPMRDPGAPRDKAPRRNQRKSGENEETKLSNERAEKGDLQTPNEEIKTKIEIDVKPEVKTERPETPDEVQLFVDDQTPMTPEQKFIVTDETPITLKDLPLTDESSEDAILDILEWMVSYLESKEEYKESIWPKTDESDYSTLTKCDQALVININALASKRVSLEADLEIGPYASSSNSFIWKEKTPSPANTPPATSPARDAEVHVQTNKEKFWEIMGRIDTHNAKKAHKLKYKMFLPTAFSDFNFTETTITELYGLFQVSDVVMHFDEKGERLGSGCLQVEHDMCRSVKKWARNYLWKAIRIQPLPKEPLPRLVLTMYLEHSCNQPDSCYQIMKKLTDEYGALDYQILFSYEEKSLRTATFRMNNDIAFNLNQKLRFSGEIVFDNPNTIKIFEIVGLSD